MKRSRSRQLRVLGIAVSTRGIGFALMEGENRLVDWGVKAAKRDKNARSLSNLAKLLAYYNPEVLVLENTASAGSRRCPRIQALTKRIVALAEGRRIKVKQFSRRQVTFRFFADGQGTKHELAEHLAGRFPEELGFRLPPKRKAWMNEDGRMDIFDAVALAVHALRVGAGNDGGRWNV